MPKSNHYPTDPRFPAFRAQVEADYGSALPDDAFFAGEQMPHEPYHHETALAFRMFVAGWKAALSPPAAEGKEETAEALRSEVLTIFKANKMANDESLAILIAERLALSLSTPAPAAEGKEDINQKDHSDDGLPLQLDRPSHDEGNGLLAAKGATLATAVGARGLAALSHTPAPEQCAENANCPAPSAEPVERLRKGLEARGVEVSGAADPVTAALVMISHLLGERDGNPLAKPDACLTHQQPVEISREEWCRLIHEELGGGDPDSMMHHPAQKSWEDPSQRRWEQWGDLADAILSKLSGYPLVEEKQQVAAGVEASGDGSLPVPPEPPRSAGQRLCDSFAATFEGGGWADAPEWENFDERQHKRWERAAEHFLGISDGGEG